MTVDVAQRDMLLDQGAVFEVATRLDGVRTLAAHAIDALRVGDAERATAAAEEAIALLTTVRDVTARAVVRDPYELVGTALANYEAARDADLHEWALVDSMNREGSYYFSGQMGVKPLGTVIPTWSYDVCEAWPQIVWQACKRQFGGWPFEDNGVVALPPFVVRLGAQLAMADPEAFDAAQVGVGRSSMVAAAMVARQVGMVVRRRRRASADDGAADVEVLSP